MFTVNCLLKNLKNVYFYFLTYLETGIKNIKLFILKNYILKIIHLNLYCY